MLSPNTILQNRYRVVRELGHGGMGTVYEAIDQRVNCVVALKQTLVNSDQEARSAFQREAALLANLRHQALPKVMDYFSETDGDFLVMEFIPGNDLAELLELRGSPFPETQVLQWADELLKVLEYLHGQHPPILHRDIKPANLKLTKQGEIFLLDFGLAKGSAGQMATLETSRSVRGYTPVYSSLEQMHGHGTDARSDIYSLGATLYHLVTGTRPLDAPARYHAVEDGQGDPLTPIGKLNAQVSSNVAAVIHQAMAISRKDRHPSATEMRNLLRQAAADAQRSKETRAEIPPTIAPPLSPLQLAQSKLAPPALAATTMPGELVSTHKDTASISSADSVRTTPAGRQRTLIVIAAGVVVLLLGGLVVWLVRGRAVDHSGDRQVRTGLDTTSPPKQPPPVIKSPPGMVYVSGGSFTMGRENGDDSERPPHDVSVKPFFIDADELTNEEYEKFVKAANHRSPSSWKNGTFPPGAGRRPVTGVTWDDASDYARWAGKRLPTEEEWEFAARGADGRIYPWGNDWQAAANANGAEQSTADVGTYRGPSPFGTSDMVGNAWEWTASNFRPYPGRGLPASQPTGELKVIRGGCYESTKDYATTTYRAGWPARGAATYDQTGFRLAKDIGP
jgi:formylglycine-generating enzyme required for sulfatase activity/predicted Ser/Thr protein kinase